MARRNSTTTKKKKNNTKSKRRKKQNRGRMPWQVDFKKGYKVTRDMIRDLQKPVDYKKAKCIVSSYKREYQAYQSRGRKKKDTPIGWWTKDTPKGQKVLASSNGGQTTKDAKTTESNNTDVSKAVHCFPFSRMRPS